MSFQPVQGFPRAQVGEGIIWDDRLQRLWWVDIRAPAVFCGDPETGNYDRWEMPEPVGCLALTTGAEVIVALQSGLFALEPQSGALRFLTDFPGCPPDQRPNDGAVSRAGRFYLGTCALGDRSEPTGKLYVFDGHLIEQIADGLHVANGLAFSPDDRIAYLSDSWPEVQTIWAFDHDARTGKLSNRRRFFAMHQHVGRPDGACVDAQGAYWSAGVGGGEVLKLSMEGEVELKLPFPVERPSKLCFGGPNLTTLFVSTLNLDAVSRGQDGLIFKDETQSKGRPEPKVELTV